MSSGFAVVDVDGITPVKSNINTTPMSTIDGSFHISSRTPERNITISLRIVADDVEAKRQELYRYCPIKERVKVRIVSTNLDVYIYGYVEHNDVPIFVREQTANISLICPDPYFNKSDGGTVTAFSNLSPEFEFPFESTIGGDLLMGDLVLDYIKNIYYEGDGETGVIMNVHSTGTVSNLSVSCNGVVMTIDDTKLTAITGSGIVSGDDIEISTLKGFKYVTLTRGGVATNILNALEEYSNWITLTKGDNVFSYTADSGESNLYFTLSNPVKYGGV